MRLTPTTSDTEVSGLEKKNLGHITQIIGPVLNELRCSNYRETKSNELSFFI